MSGRESGRPPQFARFVRNRLILPLYTAQIGAQIARVILAEFDLRYGRMAGRNPALEHARHPVEIDPLPQRRGMAAAVAQTDSMAGAAEFACQRTTVTDGSLRCLGVAGRRENEQRQHENPHRQKASPAQPRALRPAIP
jgi:hypothetical protein